MDNENSFNKVKFLWEIGLSDPYPNEAPNQVNENELIDDNL
jgi:hypothetical protein